MHRCLQYIYDVIDSNTMYVDYAESVSYIDAPCSADHHDARGKMRVYGMRSPSADARTDFEKHVASSTHNPGEMRVLGFNAVSMIVCTLNGEE